MKEFKVDRVYSKEFDGKNGKWTKYSAKCGDKWLTLKGAGAADVKDGDTIRGEYATKDYTTKDGKEGTEHSLTLIDPMIADLIKRVGALEESVFGSSKPEEKSANDDSDGLPF